MNAHRPAPPRPDLLPRTLPGALPRTLPRTLPGTVLAALDRAGIEWCVMGGHETYPVVATDLDLLVAPAQYREAIGIVRGSARGRIVQRKRYSGRGETHMLRDDAGGIVPVDILGEPPFDYLGIPVARPERLLGDIRRAPNGLPVLPPETEFLLRFAKRLAKLSVLRPEAAFGPAQTARLSALYRAAPDACESALSAYLGPDGAATAAAAAGPEDWRPVVEAAHDMGRAFRRAAIRRDPLGPARRWARQLQRLPDRAMRPNGLMVAILGPDGSGKTRLQSALAARLAPLFDRVELLHLKPGDRRHAGTGEIAEPRPHAGATRGVLRSWLQLLHWGTLYAAGYWLRIYPARIRQSLILADRYHADLLCDPKRYRYGGPGWAARLTVGLLPGPDLWIVLDASPETLSTRKDELSPEAARGLCAAYRRFAEGASNRIAIDADADAEQVARAATDAVLDWLARRNDHD